MTIREAYEHYLSEHKKNPKPCPGVLPMTFETWNNWRLRGHPIDPTKYLGFDTDLTCCRSVLHCCHEQERVPDGPRLP